MRRFILALIASGILSLAVPARAQRGYPTYVGEGQGSSREVRDASAQAQFGHSTHARAIQPSPLPMYRAFGPPLPYRVYRPAYRPYAHGGRQGVGYAWGFPWVYGGY